MRHRDIRNDQIIPNGRIEPESNIEDSLEQATEPACAAIKPRLFGGLNAASSGNTRSSLRS